MSDAYYTVPPAVNEVPLDYAPGTPERTALQEQLKQMKSTQLEVPMTIGGKKITTDTKVPMHPPHELKHTLGHYHKGGAEHVNMAIDAAMKAKPAWESMPWQERAAIFLKAADLIAGPYRYKMNAATMLGQSKTAHQSEIDAVCELIDFLRFNVHYMAQVYEQQPPISPKGIWNRLEQRPLEGFILAITPFNFTANAGNLPTSAAMMGNVVLWKPAETQIYAANLLMQIFREAGLPDGVINLINVEGPEVGKVVFKHPDFAGLHFTGSTKVFKELWKTIGNNIDHYRSYPRIVGETGGKDFIMAHKSADPKALATAMVRGAFEFQGQKCSAASRVYVPNNLWDEVKGYVMEDIRQLKVGDVEDFRNFMGAVISETAFDKITKYIDDAREADLAEIIAGGEYDKSEGYFVQPTIIQAHDPKYTTMQEEIFGPVLTVYVYQAERFEETLELLDQTSPYALTGAIFSQDRAAVELAARKLRHAAGNFYINDKPTGAVVGQQPFGGARGSGTNDKAGAMINLLRWVSPRTIKENFVPPYDFRYPYMGDE